MLKKILLLSSGTAGAQLISFLSMILIARLYTVEDFGVLSIITNISSVLIPISFLCLHLGFFTNNKNTKNLLKTCTRLCFQFSIFIFICLLFFNEYILKILNLEFGYFLFFIPLIVFFGGLQQAHYYYHVNENNLKMLSKSTFTSAIGSNLYKIIAGYIFPNSYNLIIGYNLVYIFQYINLRKVFFNKIKSSFKRDIFFIKKNKDIVLYRSPQNLINTFSELLPILVITMNFGAREAGLYTMARSILSVPSIIVGKSITDAFLPEFKKIKGTYKFNILLKKSIFLLFLISILIYIPFMFFGSTIFEVFLGKQWIEAGEAASYLSVWLVGLLSTRTVISAITINDMQKYFLYFEIFAVICKILTLYLIIIMSFDYLDVLKYYSILNLVLYVLLIFMVFRKKSGLSNDKKNSYYE